MPNLPAVNWVLLCPKKHRKVIVVPPCRVITCKNTRITRKARMNIVWHYNESWICRHGNQSNISYHNLPFPFPWTSTFRWWGSDIQVLGIRSYVIEQMLFTNQDSLQPWRFREAAAVDAFSVNWILSVCCCTVNLFPLFVRILEWEWAVSFSSVSLTDCSWFQVRWKIPGGCGIVARKDCFSCDVSPGQE